MSENKHLTPVCIIYVDGKRLDTIHEGALKNVLVNDRLNGISQTTLLFDMSAERIRDLGTFVLESKVSIHLGYKDDMKEVFEGELAGFRTIHPEYGSSMLEIIISSYLHRLNHGHRTRNFNDKTSSKIIENIIQDYGLTCDIDNFGVQNEFIVQDSLNDFDYIMYLAEQYGKDIYAQGKKIYISDLLNVSREEVVLEWGKSLINLTIQESTRDLITDCTVTGWSIEEGRSFTGTAKVEDLDKNTWINTDKLKNVIQRDKWTTNIITTNVADIADTKIKAKAILRNNSREYLNVEGSTEGNNKIIPCMFITIKYVGEGYNGDYLVDTVIHEFDCNSFITSFKLKRNMLENVQDSKKSAAQTLEAQEQKEQEQLLRNEIKNNHKNSRKDNEEQENNFQIGQSQESKKTRIIDTWKRIKFKDIYPEYDKKIFKDEIEIIVQHLYKHGLRTEFDKIEAQNKIIWLTPGDGYVIQYLPDIYTIEINTVCGNMLVDNSGQVLRNKVQSPALIFLHEIAHAVQHLYNTEKFFKDKFISVDFYRNEEERRVIQEIESQAALILGEPTRTNHNGIHALVMNNIGFKNE